MFGKGAMSRHERYCRKNPNNQHQCFKYCVHLEKTHENIETGDYSDSPRITNMRCKIKDILMFSYKFEKNTSKPTNALDELERMPLECDLYKCEEGHDFSDQTPLPNINWGDIGF
jgi:hypothetical protein